MLDADDVDDSNEDVDYADNSLSSADASDDYDDVNEETSDDLSTGTHDHNQMLIFADAAGTIPKSRARISKR